MERTASTDQRLDELATRMEAGFGRIDERFQRLEQRLEQRMDAGFERVDRDLRELRQELRDIREIIFPFGGRIMVALVGVILVLIGALATGLVTG